MSDYFIRECFDHEFFHAVCFILSVLDFKEQPYDSKWISPFGEEVKCDLGYLHEGLEALAELAIKWMSEERDGQL